MLQQSKLALLFSPTVITLFTSLVISLLLSSCQSVNHEDHQRLSNSESIFASQDAETLSLRCTTATTALQQQLSVLEDSLTDSSLTDINDLSFLTNLDNFYIQLENNYSVAQLYSNTHPNADIRRSASSCQKSIESVLTDANLSQAIYQQLQQIDSSNSNAITQRYHKKLLNDFTRSGVNKDQQLRDTLRQLQIDIADLGQQFSKNIREDVRHITIDTIETLNGLPQDYIDGLSKNDEGQWLVTTDYPSIFPFLRYAQDDKKRLAIYKLFLDRGYPNNEILLKQIISKRDQLAKYLGYDNYAGYVTEVAMIATPNNASTFIDRIAKLAKPRSERDYNQLLAQLQTIEPQAEKVGNWQKAFLEEQVKKEQYQYDAKAVREYFAYDDVKQGIFELAGQLFDVEIVPWQTSTWHPAVSTHELRRKNGETLGYFYLDMHPRDGKYKHAAHFGIKTGVLDKQLPVSALICNFPGEDKALDNSGQRLNRGLMEHNQVETFLHEFGHLMHSLIGGHQAWSGLSGIATERDFVEAPSQLLEEWVWNYDTLKTFAVNAEGETIPKAMVDKMQRARGFGKGTHIRNQMFYAALSLDYYSSSPETLDLNKTLIRLQHAYSPFDYINDTHFYANFGHLYGYSARYYTYMWSLVIAADLFSEFEREGLLNSDVAARYRDKVLAPGGSKDAADLVADFLGRPFNYDAFIEQLNAE